MVFFKLTQNSVETFLSQFHNQEQLLPVPQSWMCFDPSFLGRTNMLTNNMDIVHEKQALTFL